MLKAHEEGEDANSITTKMSRFLEKLANVVLKRTVWMYLMSLEIKYFFELFSYKYLNTL